jgi:hypothetical protein
MSPSRPEQEQKEQKEVAHMDSSSHGVSTDEATASAVAPIPSDQKACRCPHGDPFCPCNDGDSCNHVEQPRAESLNWHVIIGPNGMCRCGVKADGTVETCAQLFRAETARFHCNTCGLDTRVVLPQLHHRDEICWCRKVPCVCIAAKAKG